MRTYKPRTPEQKKRKQINQKIWRLKNQDKLKEQRKARAPKLKDTRLRYRYGISLAEFQSRLAAQKGLCKICCELIIGVPHLDHDHTTKIVRGILCGLCNKGLGQFKDDIKNLRSAVRYLKAASETRGPEPLIQASTRAQGQPEAAVNSI